MKQQKQVIPKQKKKQKQKKATSQPSKLEELGLKPANEITEIDDLQFELNRLRSLMEMWDYDLTFEGVKYHMLVDPMNRNVSMMRTEK